MSWFRSNHAASSSQYERHLQREVVEITFPHCPPAWASMRPELSPRWASGSSISVSAIVSM